jgi:hypothetical protein
MGLMDQLLRDARSRSRSARPSQVAGDDQRRPRFVDEDRVDLVDDPERVASLDDPVE